MTVFVTFLQTMEKKDPQQFFAWPVTDKIAPGYSSIIKKPMDFSTMKGKIMDEAYSSLEEFTVSLRHVACADYFWASYLTLKSYFFVFLNRKTSNSCVKMP
jgi:hypothetical protein